MDRGAKNEGNNELDVSNIDKMIVTDKPRVMNYNIIKIVVGDDS